MADGGNAVSTEAGEDLPFHARASFFLDAAVKVSNSKLVRQALKRLVPNPFAAQDTWPVDRVDGTTTYRPASPPPAVGATLLFGLPAFVVFAGWMVLVVQRFPSTDPQMVARMWLAGLWALIAPALIVTWECRRIGTLKTIAVTCDHGWNKKEMQQATRFADRWMYPMMALVAVAVGAGYVASREYFAQVVGLGSLGPVEVAIGTLSTAWLGATFGMGFWGVGAMLTAAWTALKVPPKDLTWEPFKARQVPGMESLSRFAYATGLLFSMGAIFLPGVLAILPGLEPIPRLIGMALSALLLLGGLVSFLVPSVWIDRTVRAQRDLAIDRLSPAMESLRNSMERFGSDGQPPPFPDEAEGLVALRASILDASAAPWSYQLGLRAASLLFLPIAVTVLSRPFGGG